MGKFGKDGILDPNAKPEPKGDNILVESMYGINTKQPLVKLTIGELLLQISPDHARDLAISLIDAAEAAEHDAWLFEFTKEQGATDGQAAGMVVNYRKFRAGDMFKKGDQTDGR